MQCTWPRGCYQDALVDDVRCYYHLKVIAGLITPDWYLMDTRTAKPRPEARARLARDLASAGAAPEVVAYAETVPMFPSHIARHRDGYMRNGSLRYTRG